MLPPVNTVANSSVAFQDPRTAQDAASETHVRPQGTLPPAAKALEQLQALGTSSKPAKKEAGGKSTKPLAGKPFPAKS